MQPVIDYIVTNWLELTAAILGVIAVILQIRIDSFYWIVSILNVGLYIGVYASQKLYALMILMVYYVVMSVYGWYVWRFGTRHGHKHVGLRITHTHVRSWIYLVIIVNILFLLIAWLLYEYTDSTTPVLDGIITALSFAATWMLARKKIENWLVWLVVDFISIFLYTYQKMYPTLGLYIFLCIMAVIGYFSWRKKMKHGVSV